MEMIQQVRRPALLSLFRHTQYPPREISQWSVAMEQSKAETVRVPDAQLYYEVRGSGPLLIMIAAGAGDASSYLSTVEYLVEHYTVVTYDRRGFARSPVDDPEQPIEISTHSHDIDYILDTLGANPPTYSGAASAR